MDVTVLKEERDKLERLLLGACRSLASAGGVTWGLEVATWWKNHPEGADAKARSAVLSVSDDEYAALQIYIAVHGELPPR